MEMPGTTKSQYRLLAFIETCVRELGYYLQELYNDKPRSTNLKIPLRRNILATSTGGQIFSNGGKRLPWMM